MNNYCGSNAGYINFRAVDSGNNLLLTRPNLTENNSYDATWLPQEYCNYVQLSADTWAMTPDGFSDEQPAPTYCSNYLNEDDWDVCFRLDAFEIRFID